MLKTSELLTAIWNFEDFSLILEQEVFFTMIEDTLLSWLLRLKYAESKYVCKFIHNVKVCHYKLISIAKIVDRKDSLIKGRGSLSCEQTASNDSCNYFQFK